MSKLMPLLMKYKKLGDKATPDQVETDLLNVLEDKSKKSEIQKIFDDARERRHTDVMEFAKMVFNDLTVVCPDVKPLASMMEKMG
ncbi:hypothetical protein OG897_32490 [Streptomyces sp. NBC_00237]|uniref:hypothetical protein n=1 Tax=Streptomyces sp. NBC_00237 TaxID=2975687 RepID=UPI00224D6CFF|nr:hypothetical protein [Streptomyces sp. NBC_00237]MCX5206116.1 hypothetical protein [Streptomyces sp. NBC_00237]